MGNNFENMSLDELMLSQIEDKIETMRSESPTFDELEQFFNAVYKKAMELKMEGSNPYEFHRMLDRIISEGNKIKNN